jgi:hypothetical protein
LFLILIIPTIPHTHFTPVEKCILSNNILDYHIVSQGKTTIPSVDDAEEMTFTDVRNRITILNTNSMFSHASNKTNKNIITLF